MLQFLVSDEVNLMQDLLATFVNRKTLDTLKTTADLCKFNMEKNETHRQVDMGFSAEKLIWKPASMKHTHTTVLRLCGICPGQPG